MSNGAHVFEANVQAHTMSPVDRSLSPFSRGILREVAHMLRSPIGSIIMLTDALRERGHEMTPEQREDHLAIVYRAALGVSELAGDLLTIVDDGVVEAPPRKFSPERMLSVIADVTRPVATVRGCAVSLSAPEESVVAPESTIARVMLALALRAVLRTRGGGVLLSATRDGPQRMEFVVVRHGASVVPEGGVSELLQVFRVEPETGDYTLSVDGLGLAATEKLLRSMGSALRLEATTGGALRLAFFVSTDSER